MIARFLIVLALELGAIVAAVVWMIRSPGPASATAMTITCIVAIPVIAATAFHLLWRPMLAAFPPRSPSSDAVHRAFQSFGLGIVNMSLSVHVAVDEEFLHLIPLPILRVLGARAASIPWSAMEPVGTSGRVARVGGHRLDGPRWCMELVAPRSRGDERDDERP